MNINILGESEDGGRLFPVIPRNRTSSNRHRLKHRKLYLNIIVRVTEHWSRLPMKVVKSPPLEIQ